MTKTIKTDYLTATSNLVDWEFQKPRRWWNIRNPKQLNEGRLKTVANSVYTDLQSLVGAGVEFPQYGRDHQMVLGGIYSVGVMASEVLREQRKLIEKYLRYSKVSRKSVDSYLSEIEQPSGDKGQKLYIEDGVINFSKTSRHFNPADEYVPVAFDKLDKSFKEEALAYTTKAVIDEIQSITPNEVLRQCRLIISARLAAIDQARKDVLFEVFGDDSARYLNPYGNESVPYGKISELAITIEDFDFSEMGVEKKSQLPLGIDSDFFRKQLCTEISDFFKRFVISSVGAKISEEIKSRIKINHPDPANSND